MLRFKQGVTWQGVSPELTVAMLVVAGVLAPHTFDRTCWITSIRDGMHSKESRHYIGEAFDCRSKSINAGESKQDVLEELKKALPGYVVLLEYDGQDNEHFHVQRNEGSL